MDTSRYRTPSPERKPTLLNLTRSPSPRLAAGPSQPPQAPKKKRKAADTLFIDDESSQDEQEDSDFEVEIKSPTKKASASSSSSKKSTASKKQKVIDGWQDIPLWSDNTCPVASVPGEM